MATNVQTRFRVNGNEIDKIYHSISENYQYSSSDKKLGSILAKINKDQKVLADQILELIKKLHEESRINDSNIHSVVSDKLKEICEIYFGSTSITDAQKAKLKSKVESVIKLNISSSIQKSDISKIKSEIETEIDALQTTYETDIQNDIRDLKNSIPSQTDLASSIASYRSVLSDSNVIGKISSVISKCITTKYLERDKRIFSNKLSAFKRRNEDLFKRNENRMANRMSFSQMIKEGGRNNIFLIKYNKVVMTVFARNAKKFKTMSNDQKYRNMLPNIVYQELKKSFKSWFKSKTKFLEMFKPSFWKKKFNNILSKIKKAFKFKNYGGMLTNVLMIGSSIISGVGDFLIKGAVIGGKIGLKVIGGIFNAVSSLATFTVGLLKGIVGTTFKILKSMSLTAYGILNKVKVFLFTPFGAYITGFIVGFFKERIKLLFGKLVNKLEFTYGWVKEKVTEIKEWFKKKDSEWSSPIIIRDKDGNGIGTKNTIYYGMKIRILSIYNVIHRIFDILGGDSKTKVEDIKGVFQKETNYSKGVLGTEQFFDGVQELYNDLQEGPNSLLYRRAMIFLDEIQRNEFLRKLQLSFDLAGTGIPSAKIAEGITNSAVSNAFKYGGVIIGSILGGPFGAIIGGSIGGILSGISTYMISRWFKSNAKNSTPSEKMAIKGFLQRTNKKYESFQSMTLKSDAYKKYKKIKEEIEDLKKNSGKLNDQQVQEKQKEAKKYEFASALNEDNGIYSRIEGRLAGLTTGQILKNPSDKIIDFLINDGELQNNGDELYNLGGNRFGNIIKEVNEWKGSRIKYLLMKFGYDRSLKIINDDQYKKSVSEGIDKLQKKKYGKGDLKDYTLSPDNTIGNITQKFIEWREKINKYILDIVKQGGRPTIDQDKMFNQQYQESIKELEMYQQEFERKKLSSSEQQFIESVDKFKSNLSQDDKLLVDSYKDAFLSVAKSGNASYFQGLLEYIKEQNKSEKPEIGNLRKLRINADVGYGKIESKINSVILSKEKTEEQIDMFKASKFQISIPENLLKEKENVYKELNNSKEKVDIITDFYIDVKTHSNNKNKVINEAALSADPTFNVTEGKDKEKKSEGK